MFKILLLWEYTTCVSKSGESRNIKGTEMYKTTSANKPLLNHNQELELGRERERTRYS